MEGRLLRVVDVDAVIKEDRQGQYVSYIPMIICKLEDSRLFYLYHVPYEIVKAIRSMKGENNDNINKKRNSLFDILPMFESTIEQFKEVLEKVVIDELDPVSALYTAKLFLNLGGKVKMKIPMIPSHAIYLALLTQKPIYVDESLIEDEYWDEGDAEI